MADASSKSNFSARRNSMASTNNSGEACAADSGVSRVARSKSCEVNDSINPIHIVDDDENDENDDSVISEDKLPSPNTHFTSNNPPLPLGDSILGAPKPAKSPSKTALEKNGQIFRIRDEMRRRLEANEAASRDNGDPGAGTSNMSGEDLMSDDGDDKLEHERLCNKWKKKEKEFKKRQKRGILSKEEEFEFARQENAERVRRIRWEQSQTAENGEGQHGKDDNGANSFFVPEGPGSKRGHSALGPDLEEAAAAEDRRRKNALRMRQNASIHSVIGDDSSEESLSGQKNTRKDPQSSLSAKGKGRRGGPKEKSKDKANVNSGAKKTSAKKSKDKQDTVDLKKLPNIFQSNMFEAVAENEQLDHQPDFYGTKRKADALKQLLAAVPKELKRIGQADKKTLLEASRDFSSKGIIKPSSGEGDEESGWLLKGMKSKLKHFQLLGTAFMRKREKDITGPFGGLHADSMGFGKTVMQLANIVDGLHRINRKDKNVTKTTLIVATPALISQWFQEIHRHCDMNFLGRVLVYHGRNKILTNDVAHDLQQYEIILTTYNEVQRSYPKVDYPPDITDEAEKKIWWDQFCEDNKGPLHRIQFLRVILDEAQAIKNRKSHTSYACRTLQGEYRWCITGTPILNATEELYPYFKFLRVPNTGNFKTFRANYIGPDDPSKLQRLQIMLSRFLLRRLHGDRLFGMPLVKLPNIHKKVFWVTFSDFERNVYECVRKRMIERINSFSRRGELSKNYSNVLTMILRLRQLTGHILSVDETLRDILELEDLERLRKLAEEEDDTRNLPRHTEHLQHLRFMLARKTESGDDDLLSDMAEQSAVAGNACNENPESLPSDLFVDGDEAVSLAEQEKREKKNFSTGGSHGLKLDLVAYLENLRQSDRFQQLQQEQKCVSCDDHPSNPWITSCYHVLCLECLTTIQEIAAFDDGNIARCPECRDILYHSEPMEDWVFASQPSNANDKDPNVKGNGKKRTRAKKKTQVPDWRDQPDRPIIPSAKTLAIKAQLLNWFEKEPDQKVIVYTQFMSMVGILQRMCAVEKWKFLTYHGGMTHEERSKSLFDFDNEPDCKIMIMSLKAGGVGLNLTMANKVIIVDLWFNHAVEEQAFCRVFRIGQKNETYLTRLAVQKTIDSALIDMQERKKNEIADVMEGTGKSREKITMRELLELFGPVREDGKGTPYIVIENEKDTNPNPIDDEEDEIND